MTLQPFTDNFKDNSSDAGFQFTFYCDICNEGYKTEFIKSETHSKGKLLDGIGKAVSIGASLLGKHSVGWNLERGADALSDKFEGKSPQWRKEHEEAFEKAQNEAKEHFHRCPKCTKWVCENDWNEQTKLCVECAPREGVEVASARAKKKVKDIREKASKTQVFTGEVDKTQTICPKCGKPAGEGKYCNNCGAKLELIECPKCGAELQPSARFCDECGEKL